MPRRANSSRLDVLLALELTFFGERQITGAKDSRESAGAGSTDISLCLGEDDRKAFELRRNHLRSLSAVRRQQWLMGVLRQAKRGASTNGLIIDEHLHPSQVFEAIRKERRSAQALILRCLPVVLAEKIALALETGDIEDAPEQIRAQGALRRRLNGRAIPDQRIVAIVRRKFLANCVCVEMLSKPTALDFLSGSEIRVFVYLLGVREVAFASHTQSLENPASCMEGLPLQDSQAVRACINTVTGFEERRTVLAQQLVKEIKNQGVDPQNLIYYVGLSILAKIMSVRDPLSVALAAQKFPILIARELLNMTIQEELRSDSGITDLLIEDAEALTLSLKEASMAGASNLNQCVTGGIGG